MVSLTAVQLAEALKWLAPRQFVSGRSHRGLAQTEASDPSSEAAEAGGQAISKTKEAGRSAEVSCESAALLPGQPYC
jgi:hypothetical protein